MSLSTAPITLKNIFWSFLFSALVFCFALESGAAINFTFSGLQGESLNNPTSLQFGPDGRLYVSQQDGTIFAYTINRQSSNNYVVTNVETILLVKYMLNHDDDGAVNTSLGKRQVTGILLSGTAQQPILYVSSSDPREGGPSGDTNLDTNSGVLSRLTWNGNGWDKIDLVRGLPRSEENHSVNGMQLDKSTNTLYLAVGGSTNAGSPSQNFASLTEYAYSCAILSIDLDTIDAMPTQSDSGLSALYKYDLPTLDDPDRANSSGNEDINDPWGGNDGLNQAKLVVGGPVQIYASGFRNAYDLLITRLPGKEGRMYTVDNGPNGGWGGHPIGEGPPVNEVSSATNQYLTGEPGSTGPGTGGDAKVNNQDNLHFVTESYYGGHPTPIRANPTGAGLYTNDTNDASQGIWRTQAEDLPIDWPPVPPSMTNPIEGDYLQPGVDDNALATFGSSTNGMAEYTASNFDGELQGDLILASFSGNLERIQLNSAGTEATNVSTFASNFGSLPLDVVAQGDNDPFPGTIWAATYGSNNISIFEPIDYEGGNDFACNGVYDFNIDEDGDGYSNAEEIDNGNNPCSASDVPADFDRDIISNLFDPDDDNDGILDTQDPYPQDKYNGRSTSIPLDYPMLNGDPGIGFYGLGFTGLMSNGSDDYLALLNDELLIPGGTAGVLTIDGVSQTSAFEGQNNQENALQFGIDVNSTSGAFLIHVRMPGDVFGSIIPTDGRSIGAYIGTGDQDNYLMFAAVATSSGPALTLVHENNAIAETLTPLPNITSLTELVNLNLFFLVNPGLGNVQPQYSIDGGALTNLGTPVPLSGSLLSALQGPEALAVGVIASATNDDRDFTAQWDFINITPIATDAPGDWADLAPAEAAPPSCACHENAYVKAGNKYYLIGGRGDGRSVKIYDPSANTWTSGASLPTQMHHFQAVELDGLIYVIGAWTGVFPNEQNLSNIYIYNPVSDSWRAGPPIPDSRNRGSAGAIAYNGKIYVVAGNDGGHNTGATLVSWFDEFDPATGTWTQLSDAPRGRDHFQVAIINDKMYAAGGRDSSSSDMFGSVIGKVDVYDFNSNSWSTLSEDIPTKRAGTAAVTYNGEFIVIGGESSQAEAHNEVEALNPQTNTWRSLAPLNQGRHGTQAIVDNGAIYMPAGSKTQGSNEIDSNATYFQEIYQLHGLLASDENPLTPGVLTPSSSSLIFSTIQGLLPQTTNIILSNTGGDQAITVNGITKSGYAGIGLNFNQAFPVIIPPNQTIVFQVTFDSNLPGEKTGDIYVQHEGENQNLTIPINGGGSNLPLLLYRVNAGGIALAGSDGLNWSTDTKSEPSIYVNSSQTNDTYSVSNPITAGPSVPSDVPLALFQSERWDSFYSYSSSEMQWNFPVSNGNYEVRLYFAETYTGAGTPGKRVFDIIIEDILALDNYDVVADAGDLFVGVMQSFEVEVSDESITIELLHVTQNPAIKGIEIIDLNDGVGGPVNNVPVITSISDQLSNVLDNVSLQAQATDVDSDDTLSYSATGLPSGLSITPSSGLISGTIASDANDSSPYMVTITVTDDGNPQESADISFYWNVEATNQQSQVLYRVNTGGNLLPSIDAEPVNWSADTKSEPSTYVNSSQTNDTYSVSNPITAGPSVPSGVPLALFQSERWDSFYSYSSSEMQWNFPVSNGNYEVRLYFAETYTGAGAPGKRVFDVVIEDILVLDNYDVVADAGDLFVGVMQSFEVEVSDDALTIELLHVTQNPAIKGIEIIDLNDGVGGPVNNAPVITSISDQFSNVLDSVSLQAQATDVDSDDTLSFSASGLPSGLSITSSGLISGAISSDTNNSSPYMVTITVTDDGDPQESDSTSFNWTVNVEPPVNSNPIIALIDDQNGTAGDMISLQVIASDINVIDTLTYSISGQPPGLAISPSSGVISGILSNDADIGSPYQVIVTVTDDGNPQGSASDSFAWTVDTLPTVNNPPVITSIGDQTDQAEDLTSLQVMAFDSDLGDTLSYSATGLPSGLSITPSSGLISGTIASDANDSSPYMVTITVTDDGNPQESADISFYWNVEATNQQSQVLYRVNTGGNLLPSIDAEPVNWSADTKSEPSIYVNSSQTNDTYSVSNPITAGPSVPSGVPLALFQSERWDSFYSYSSSEMQWNFPVSDGNYEVRLYFAETYTGAGTPGKRVFDVFIEDILVLDNYDIVADAGAMFVGVMQSFEVEVSDDALTIELLHITQNPAIKGIEIIKQPTLLADIATSPTQFGNDVMQVFSIDNFVTASPSDLLSDLLSGSLSSTNEVTLIHNITQPLEPSWYSGYLSDTNTVTGNFQLLAKVKTLVSGGERPEVGIIIEEASSSSARFVQLGIQLDHNYYARALTDINGDVEEFDINTTGELPNTWMLLERSDDQISIAVSSDDLDYQLLKTVTIPGLSETLEAGVYIDSGSQNIEAEATIENLEIIPMP